MKLLLAGGGLLTLLGSLLSSIFSISHYPNDAEGTLSRVRNGVVRVGYTPAEPWVSEGPTGPQGLEVNLVADFARQQGTRVEWVPGSEGQLFRALKHHQIDLLIGGITDESPWQDEVGLTRPYLKATLYVGMRPGPTTEGWPAGTIKGRTVAVRGGTDQGYYVDKEDGRAFPVANMPGKQDFAVGFAWQLRQWGLRNTGIELTTENHVMAVPPGENAWQVALETYLENHQPIPQAE